MVRFVNTNYPSLDAIFNNYQNVIRTIVKTSTKKPEVVQNASSKVLSVKPKKSFETKVENKSTLKNFSTNLDKILDMFDCKFCSIKGYSILNCIKYPDVKK